MKVVRLVVTGLLVGAATAFVAALLRPRPRRPGVYDPVTRPDVVPPTTGSFTTGSSTTGSSTTGSPVPAAGGADPDGRR